MLNSAQIAANELIKNIKIFWGKNVSDIKIINLSDIPFDMFTLIIKLYGIYEVKMVYDRLTLGLNLNIDGQFIGLSRLTQEPIFKGFEGYYPENLLHNFEILDKVLQSYK